MKRDHLDDGIESFLVEKHQKEKWPGPKLIVHYKMIDFSHETKTSEIIYGQVVLQDDVIAFLKKQSFSLPTTSKEVLKLAKEHKEQTSEHEEL